ncbi:MAG: hypothetical protein HYT41_02835 [Candidatus Sungbacteria bacterium]|nr:hypothetical protein [Candidatus Sungbacteria bacterium]
MADSLGAGAIFYFGLYVLMGVLSYLLGLVGGILDYVFLMNTYVNPGQIYIVQQGWLILRDLANGIFILLLLWIAITIIFNLDQYGGKRFLVRIIMVALLINFSLAMVSTVFALGNKLAEPFATAMKVLEPCTESTNASGQATRTCPPPKTTLSKVIIANSQVHEVTKIFTDVGALNAFKQEAAQASQPQIIPNSGATPITTSPFRSIAHYLGAPQPAQAVGVSTAGKACLGVGLAGAVVSGGTSAVVGAACALVAEIGIPLVTAWFFSSTDIPAQLIQTVLNLVVADAFLVLTLLGILSAAIILLLRLVAMAFLGVFAPVAFLGIAFPKFGDKIWSSWIDNLFRWAFTAPIFYFLLYLALLMLESNAGGVGASQAVPFAANFFKILNLVLFLVFLWAAVYMTRKTAGHFADVALNLGRKAAGFGLGVATGFAARGIGKAALRLGQPGGALERTMGAIGRTPLSLALGRRTEKYIQAERERAKKREDQFKGGSEQYLAAQLRSSSSAEDVTAIARVAVKEKKWGVLKGQEDRVIKLATRLGLQEDVLKAAPHLATAKNVTGLPAGSTDTQAIAKVVERMNQEEKLNMSKDAHANTDVLDALWRTSHNNDLEQIGLKNKDLQAAMFNRLNTMNAADLSKYRGGLTSTQDNNLNQYFTGALANGTGTPWRPQHWQASSRPTAPAGSPFTVAPTHTGSVAFGSSYPRSLSVGGGSGTYTWRVSGGTPPPGITLDPAGGFVGTATGPRGNTYPFQAEVDDGAGNIGVTNVTITVT